MPEDTNIVKDVKLIADTAPTILKSLATKVPWLWIKNDAGRKSVTVTLVTVAFLVTTLAYILSIVGSVGSVVFRPFDVAACASYMTPLLALYFGRKHSDAKNGVNVSDGSPDAPPDEPDAPADDSSKK